MNKFILAFAFLGILYSCESDNIEQKYLHVPVDTTGIDTSGVVNGEIAYYPFNGNLKDTLGNDFPVIMEGEPIWVRGLNSDYGEGLHLNGNSGLIIKLGYYDTLSLVFWIKGDAALSESNNPVLFDYGLNAISAQLDATSGATALISTKDGSSASSVDASVEYLNSFCKYSFLYFEAGGNYTKIYFKGYKETGGSEIVYSENLNFQGVILANSEFLYIGRSSLRDDQKQSYFKGSIDELHIYKRPLTNSEIETFAFTQTE